jgi:hypothetical protein
MPEDIQVIMLIEKPKTCRRGALVARMICSLGNDNHILQFHHWMDA